MDVFADIIKAQRVGRALAHRQGSGNLSCPTASVFGMRFGRFVTPRIPGAILPALRGFLPLGLRRQTILPATHLAQPAAVLISFRPVDSHHRLVRMAKVRIPPFGRRRMVRGFHECRPVAVSNLEHRHFKRVDPDLMDGLLIIPTHGTAHLEITGGDQDAARLDFASI